MKKIKERLKNLKDGQVLQVYFDSMRKEGDVNGGKERVGIYPRGTEARHMDESGENRSISK